MKRVGVVAGAAAAGYAGLCTFARMAGHRFLFHPTGARRPRLEATLELPQPGGGTTRGWCLAPGHETAVVAFGGNAGDAEHDVVEEQQLFPTATLYHLAYRGYGPSDGTPSEAGIVADAVALVDQVREHHRRVVVFGRSLGSGVAMQVAVRRPLDGLVLVAPFDAIPRVFGDVVPGVPYARLLPDRFDSASVAPRVTCPVLVLHGDRDAVVQPRRTQALVRAFGRDVHVVLLAGKGHNDVQDDPAYAGELAAFVADPDTYTPGAPS